MERDLRKKPLNHGADSLSLMRYGVFFTFSVISQRIIHGSWRIFIYECEQALDVVILNVVKETVGS